MTPAKNSPRTRPRSPAAVSRARQAHAVEFWELRNSGRLGREEWQFIAEHHPSESARLLAKRRLRLRHFRDDLDPDPADFPAAEGELGASSDESEHHPRPRFTPADRALLAQLVRDFNGIRAALAQLVAKVQGGGRG